MDYINELKSAPIILVEGYGTWCPHCQRMMPVVAQVKEHLEGQVPVIQFDVDENSKLASELKVNSIPTFIIYRNGVEEWRHSGEIDGNALLAKVQSYL